MGIEVKTDIKGAIMNGSILVELQEFMGSDTSIANAAWTSTYDKDRREDKYDDPEKIAEIVSRLIRDGHGTPIESVVMRFWIRMPIFTDRQHLTHRLASHNGLSGRYRTMPDDWYSVPEDVQRICAKVFPKDTDTGFLDSPIVANYERACAESTKSYNDSIIVLRGAEKEGKITNAEFKRVREILRGQLPVAGMVERTTIFNLRSFANYQRQRNSDHAQKEICHIAQLMLEEVKRASVAPIAIKTLEEVGWRI
jgi:thymidylate synthase (FAD)